MKEQRFRRMEVWKKAMDFIEEIYKTTKKFPSEELYGLMSQLRRAATSIALNIAEGSAAESDREFNRFLTISLGSIYEVMCGIEIAVRLAKFKLLMHKILVYSKRLYILKQFF